MSQQVAGWLFRPGGCILPVASRGFIVHSGGSHTLGGGGGAHGWFAAPPHAIVPSSTSVASCLSHTAPLTTNAPPAPSIVNAARPALADSPSRMLTLPKWLRNLMPGGKDLPDTGRATVAPSGPEDSASSSGATSPDDDDLKQLDEMRHMTMQGWVEYCKKMRGSTTPPRPRPPPVPRNHPDYLKYFDMPRIAYLRNLQHERISSLITKDEEDQILAKREVVLKDRKLLESIADRTGLYIDLEVKDCIKSFLETRKRCDQQYRYVVEYGHPMPKTSEEQRDAQRFMDRMEEEEKLRAALLRRDTSACPLKDKLSWVGSSAMCELTGLRYWECCGRVGPVETQQGEQQQVPPAVQYAMRRKKQDVYDENRVRMAYKNMGGRAERRLRTAYLASLKPRFRDY